MITINEFHQLFDISEELASELLMGAKVMDVEEGTVLVKQGSAPTHVIFVIDGVIGGVRETYDGSARMNALMTKGRIAAESGVIQDLRYYGSFSAFADSRVVLVDIEHAKHVLAQNREFLELLLRSQTSKLKYATMVHYASTERDKLAKVAAILEGISDFSDLDEIPLSKEQLAGLLGMSRNTVSQSLKTLEDRGAILQQKSNIVILNKNKLSLDGSNSKLFEC
ncbi:hypothetical protein JCM19231_5038 [Vibrio ishigakensis]|uniref:Crp/Fnr family transcriptional regulator n=1 Tax=Vibrio ishigakensis TaxID=1481914 RepID=A0A0B8QIM9_9VIBR|nr:Crp/Fnr family transcriptional regulator [Vibrio ishigakensis]GAM55891.1 hypothetical protein JCM19231_5038 [Vibrio ishigakensis]GAM75003.1 hypothetical protein JCM19241_1346 [Vibrio ishigakensis]